MEKVEVLEITPAKATEMLASNINNRALRPTVVEKYKRDLIDDKWIFGTSMLIFSASGVLLDGQHRLKAIIEANKSAKMIVVTGVSEEALKVIDSGVGRTVADMFKLLGVGYSSNIGGIITRFDGLCKERYNAPGSKRITHQEYWAKYMEHKDWYDEAAKVSSIWNSKNRLFPSCLLGAIYLYLIKEKHYPENNVKSFIDQLCDVVPTQNETISNVRRVLMNARILGQKLPEAHLLVYIIRTWNAYIKNKIIKVFKNMDPNDVDVWFI